jgi:hypothetical protein
MKKIMIVFAVLQLQSIIAKAQRFDAGFEPAEYADILNFCFKGFSDTGFAKLSNGKLLNYKYQQLFISPEVGLRNKCEMYLRNDNTAILNLRGTVPQPESWLANFFSAMIAAKGNLQINDSTNFEYTVAESDKAFVHVGWMLGIAHLSPYFNNCIDSLILKGVKNFIVTGHSQGGALSFLATSYLHYKYKNKYPNLRFKTYSSAAPKPGNLFYAYDFDFITSNGFGFRIVNTEDWVPESPLTVQTLQDINEVNPVKDAKKILKGQQFFVRLYLNSIYNKMDNASTKTMKRYKKYLGNKLYSFVKKTLPQFQQPALLSSSNYMTAGTPIILMPDASYKEKFVFTGANYFVHHMFEPYMYLLAKNYSITHVEALEKSH